MKEALKLALEALENHCGNYKLDNAGCKRWNKAVAAIKEALALTSTECEKQPAQEPVAWEWRYDSCGHAVVNRLVVTETPEPTLFLKNVFARGPFPLYTTPPQRPWVGLTDDEKQKIYRDTMWGTSIFGFADALLAAVKEKNT